MLERRRNPTPSDAGLVTLCLLELPVFVVAAIWVLL